MNVNFASIIDTALNASCGGDYSKFIGRCTEAQIVAFKALAEAGVDNAWMVCGHYNGTLDEAATELFGNSGCAHSWLELRDQHGQRTTIIDPTAWVFTIERDEPATLVCDKGSPLADYYTSERGFSTQQWRSDFAEYLSHFGLTLV
jgi:hypothetical protein